MQRQTWITLLLAAAIIPGIWLLSAQQSADAQNGGIAPTKVAVVDLQEVLQNSSQQAQFKADNEAKVRQLQDQQKKRQDEIAALNVKIDPLSPGTDAWNDLRDQLQQKSLELRVWGQMQEQGQQLDQARQVAELYQAANVAAAQVAESAGYDLVLQGGEMRDPMKMTVQELQGMLQSRKVIYNKTNVDITEAVLRQINNNYTKR